MNTAVAMLLVAFVGAGLFGLYQYKANNRQWGIRIAFCPLVVSMLAVPIIHTLGSLQTITEPESPYRLPGLRLRELHCHLRAYAAENDGMLPESIADLGLRKAFAGNTAEEYGSSVRYHFPVAGKRLADLSPDTTLIGRPVCGQAGRAPVAVTISVDGRIAVVQGSTTLEQSGTNAQAASASRNKTPREIEGTVP